MCNVNILTLSFTLNDQVDVIPAEFLVSWYEILFPNTYLCRIRSCILL